MALLRKSESAIVGEGGREGCRDAGMQTGRGWPCSLESWLMAMALPTRRRVTVAAGRRQRVRRHGADTAKSGCLPPRGTTERVELKVSRRARPKPCAAASGVRLPTQLEGGGTFTGRSGSLDLQSAKRAPQAGPQEWGAVASASNTHDTSSSLASILIPVPGPGKILCRLVQKLP